VTTRAAGLDDPDATGCAVALFTTVLDEGHALVSVGGQVVELVEFAEDPHASRAVLWISSYMSICC